MRSSNGVVAIDVKSLLAFVTSEGCSYLSSKYGMKSFRVSAVLYLQCLLRLHFFQSGIGGKQTLFHKRTAKYLPGSVITSRYAESIFECSVYCTWTEGCLSVNYKASGLEQGLCELNNSTITEEAAVENDEFVYLSIVILVCTRG